jgi:uncharacterized protein YbjT (DUF2867 family)
MSRDTVVIAGATGFIGHAVAKALAARTSDRLNIVGLTRGRHQAVGAWDQLVTCDLFSLLDVERALAGARYVVYLVHSMLPSARLVQGSFADLDLICADNVGRAAKRLGIEQIVYLGGLLPHEGHTSKHLASRREVELALGEHGVAVTTLRAAMVIGRKGSSFEIMNTLVRRLPAMVLPSWTERRCQPIDLGTAAQLVERVVGRRDTYGQTFDIGGPDVLRYRDMLAVVGDVLGKRRPAVPVPFLSPRLSRAWISLVTGAPAALAKPLVESLRNDMVCRDRRLQDTLRLPGLTFRDAVDEALGDGTTGDKPHAYQPAPRVPVTGVRSVQRIPLPAGRDALWAAHEYMRWLPDGAGAPLRVEVDQQRSCTFFVAGISRPLLVLRFAPDRSTPDRQLFYVVGGLLARKTKRGRLEFRVTPDGTHLIAAIHEFSPRLPWNVYRISQAWVHRWVMWRFGRHLATQPPVDARHAIAV